MENIGRRDLVRGLLGAVPIFVLSAFKAQRALAGSLNYHFILPKKPFEIVHKTGKRKGGRLIILGGIHGNEPGAYKAADILAYETELIKGEILFLPRTNFTSIIADVRGYNGDMNRKFSWLSAKDPDYENVKLIKESVLDFKPDALLTLHDGYGFHSKNSRFWGQSIVIDEKKYRDLELYSKAHFVAKSANRHLKPEWRIPVFNTKTFHSNTSHPEQRKSLTYFCLSKASVPAFCLEASKNLPSLREKVKTHMFMLHYFLKLYDVQIKPTPLEIAENVDDYLKDEKVSVKLEINGRDVLVSSSKDFKIPPHSEIKFLSFSTRGAYARDRRVNLNWQKFTLRCPASFEIKHDFKRKFKLRFFS